MVHQRYNVCIIGGGILGVCIAFWLSEVYDISIIIIEKEKQVALHTSSRNTGVVHRPFYMNPTKKRIFARAAQKSYYLWSTLASQFNLTWEQRGTIEVATEDSDFGTLEQYLRWAVENGMRQKEEVEVLSSSEVARIEPQVKCVGAIFSKTDTSVDYGEFSNFVFQLASQNGISFIGGAEVSKVLTSEKEHEVGKEERKDKVRIYFKSKNKDKDKERFDKGFVDCDLVINVAGGGAVDIAHMMGLGAEYTDLHFRGEYWIVDKQFASKISRNIYSVAKFKDFPFLDPHFIVKADGTREIGPNAVLVAGPYAYHGFSESKLQLLSKIFESPNMPKLKLFTNRKFLSLVWHEWESSLSKKAMCERVRHFIPSLEVNMLNERGLAGVRNSLIDSKGFVPEAVLLKDSRSIHILNYNSPGATGAPAYSAYVVNKLAEEGYLEGLGKKKDVSMRRHRAIWDFEDAASGI